MDGKNPCDLTTTVQLEIVNRTQIFYSPIVESCLKFFLKHDWLIVRWLKNFMKNFVFFLVFRQPFSKTVVLTY
jgi:hypothetical protein